MEMEEGINGDGSKDAPYIGEGGVCARVGEDTTEDLNILANDFVKSSANQKRKNDIETEHCISSAMKNFYDDVKNQEKDRKRERMALERSLVHVVTQMESDKVAVQENNQQLQHLLRSLLQHAQRTKAAQSQWLQTLREVQENYSKMCKEMDARHRDEENQALVLLANTIKEQQQKLASDYRRKSADALKKAFSFL